MLHTKFRGNPEERSIQIPESTIYQKALLITKKHLEDFEVFLPYMGVVAILVM